MKSGLYVVSDDHIGVCLWRGIGSRDFHNLHKGMRIRVHNEFSALGPYGNSYRKITVLSTLINNEVGEVYWINNDSLKKLFEHDRIKPAWAAEQGNHEFTTHQSINLLVKTNFDDGAWGLTYVLTSFNPGDRIEIRENDCLLLNSKYRMVTGSKINSECYIPLVSIESMGRSGAIKRVAETNEFLAAPVDDKRPTLTFNTDYTIHVYTEESFDKKSSNPEGDYSQLVLFKKGISIKVESITNRRGVEGMYKFVIDGETFYTPKKRIDQLVEYSKTANLEIPSWEKRFERASMK